MAKNISDVSEGISDKKVVDKIIRNFTVRNFFILIQYNWLHFKKGFDNYGWYGLKRLNLHFGMTRAKTVHFAN